MGMGLGPGPRGEKVTEVVREVGLEVEATALQVDIGGKEGRCASA